MRHRLVALIITSVFALALPASALAAPAYEPNNGIHQAFGPLQAGTNYDAVISSNNDVDWYVLYASGPGVLDVELTNINDDLGCCTTVRLRDRDGEELNSASASEDSTEHIVYTTPGPGQYYVVVTGFASDRYRLRVSGPTTSGPRPGPVDEITPNNNPDITSAFGPLVGERLYGGSVDANSEEDWFFFNTAGSGAFEVAVTNINDELGCCTKTRLLDQDGNELNATSTSEDRISRMQHTAGGAARFFLRVTGFAGDRYQFSVGPAGLLTPNEPPSLSRACQKAEAKLAKATSKLAKAKRKLARAKARKQSAFTKKAKKKAQKRVKKAKKQTKRAKKQTKRANKQVRATC